MAVQADDLYMLQFIRAPVNLQRLFHGNAKLVLAQPGGDIRVGPGVDIRVDPHRDGRDPTCLARHAVQYFQFGSGFQIETVNA